MLKTLFENYRRFLTEDEAQLLIEAREHDAANRAVKDIKNKDIQEFLTTSMDMLFKIDPSGNQKYAMWIAKMLNETVRTLQARQDARTGDTYTTVDFLDVVKESIQSIISSIKENLVLYHKLTQRNLIEKDINKFDHVYDWAHAIYNAKKELEEKERMKALEKQAKSESDVIESNEDFMIVRPRTKEGSCYFGQGTRWCISSTQSQNYFDSYTGEGKGFYFVFFHHLPQNDDNKKMALVFEPGQEDEPSEVYDRADDEVGTDGLRDAVEMNLLMKGFWNSLPNKKEVKKFLNKKPEGLADILKKLQHELEIFKEGETAEGNPLSYKGADLVPLARSFKALGIDIEDNDGIEEEFAELVSEEYHNIIGTSAYHWENNPAGPTEEEYQKIEDEHDLSHYYVSREEMDEGKMYWDAGTSFQFDDIDDLVEDAVDTDTLRDFVDSALDSHYVYGEVEDNSYGGSFDISVRISPDHDEDEGIEGFSSFMETVANADKVYDEVYESVIDKMKDAGWIPGDSTKQLLEKFNEMKFQNFDVELEDGQIQMSSRLPVKILLPDELKTGDRKTSGSLSGATRGSIQGKNKRVYIHRRLIELLREKAPKIDKALQAHLQNTLDRALKIATSQLKLPLNEEKNHFKIPTANINLGLVGPYPQRSTGVNGGGQKYEINDNIIYWLDILLEGTETEDEIKVIQRFLKIIDNEEFFENIRQYTEGLVNNQVQKEILPKIKEEIENMKSKEKATDELSTLFEGWRRFLQ